MDKEKQREANRKSYQKHKTEVNARTKKWRQDHRARSNELKKRHYYKYRDREQARFRNTFLKNTYGITEAEYNALLEKQNGVCAVCGNTEKSRKGRLYVDHDHQTGRVRGLLCQKCNYALGYANDDVNILRKLIEYLNA